MKMKRKLEDFGELWLAEEKIFAEIDSGEFIVLHDGLPPETGGDYDVRATFIRYLALGGCKACRLHEKGLRVKGARIIGVLDLEGGELPRDLALFDCRFEDEVIFRSAKLQSLFLNGSLLPKGLNADRLEVKGSAYLRAAQASGEVRLLGAKLGGDLDCEGAKFNAALDENGVQTGFAFSADGLETKGYAFFRRVEAFGAVRLLGAKLGGNLECDGAKFMAARGKGGAQTGFAFSADGLEAKGALLLRSGAKIDGSISLVGAQVEALCDEAGCWPQKEGQINIDRFRYGAILGGAPTDAETRIAWLKKIYHGTGFRPQPYEQLAKVLRETGHREDARVVMIKKEEFQRAAMHPPLWRRAWNWVFGKTAGYGYRPSLSLRYLAVLLFLGMYVFGAADYFGAVKPNSTRVWHLSEWENCAGKEVSQSACYLASEKGKSYPTFNPIIYSVDTLLPIVDLEMQGAWIPDDRAGWWGIGARVYLWLHIALGWFFSLLAVAGFSGLIKPE